MVGILFSTFMASFLMVKLWVMKKIVLLLSFVSLVGVAKGQTYNPLVDTNKVWSIFVQWVSGTWNTYFTKFTSDTVINSLHYKKVLKSDDSAQINWYSNGYIREDTNKKVFYKLDIADADRLLYDFNVGINDTFTLRTLPDTLILKVDSIDSINISGKLRKRLYLERYQYTYMGYIDIWIEGIGSMNGVLTTLSLFSPGSHADYLLCFTENDTLKYINPIYNTCYRAGGLGIQGYNANPIAEEIFPNPSSDNITIETPTRSTIEISNIEGQLIKTLAASGTKSARHRCFGFALRSVCCASKNRKRSGGEEVCERIVMSYKL